MIFINHEPSFVTNKKVTIFQLLILLVIFSPYISSWLPLIGGMPVGPILRQFIFLLVFVCFVFFVAYYYKLLDENVLNIFWIYIAICLATITSLIHGSASLVQYIIGVASFIFYPAIFVFSLVLLDEADKDRMEETYLSFDRFFTFIFIGLASFGIVDVVMQGRLVEFFGYNPNYGGDDFSLITSYNDVVRANAGISDALAFGYIMAVGVIYFFHKLGISPSRFNHIGIFLCTLACVLSLTRGAIISVLLTYLIYTLTMKRFAILLILAPFVGYVLYVTPYADIFLGRFTDSDEASEISSLLRIAMAINSVDFLIENPMGMGIGTQGAGNILSDGDNRLNTDNYFFHIFLELGLFFGPIFLYYLYKQFSYAFSIIRSNQFIFSYLLLFLVSSLLSSSIAFATLGVIYWFVLYLKVLESRLSDET